MNKIISSGIEPSKRIINGMIKLRNVVASTLGPKGHNVLIYENGVRPILSKDGATVAWHVDSDDPYEKVGIMLTKDIIGKVDAEAGDGTTTTTIYSTTLAEKLVGLRNLNIDPSELRKGVDYATEKAIEFFEKNKKPLKSVKDIAMVSTNGDEKLSNLFEEAYNSIGENGSVVLADSYRRDGTSYLDKASGLKWHGGIPSDIFITNTASDTSVIEDPYILIYASGIKTLDDLSSAIELVKSEDSNLVLVAPFFEPSLWAAAASAGICFITSPDLTGRREDYHEMLNDFAVTVGTKVIPDTVSTKAYIKSLNDFGVAKLIVSSVKETQITQVDEMAEDKAQIYLEYIEKLKKEIDDNDELTIESQNQKKDRLARLSGGITSIHIGGLTPEEKEEKCFLAEDASHSIKSALKHGILPGGGTAMLKASQMLLEEEEIKKSGLSDEAIMGYKAVADTLREPAKYLISSVKPNDYQYIVQQVAHEDVFENGYNVRKAAISNLEEDGVMDSAAIEIYAMKYSASVLGSFIISDSVIINANQNMSVDMNDRKAASIGGGY